MDSHQITLDLTANTHGRLRAMSHRTGRDVDTLIREFVLQGLSDAEDQEEIQEIFAENERKNLSTTT